MLLRLNIILKYCYNDLIQRIVYWIKLYNTDLSEIIIKKLIDIFTRIVSMFIA
ncbi:hypothetical protein BCR36DRAFT_582113 [Piromyces finnis]|uniref:Uncharacterized protein n=2 Tax=Piromyces finnis TaxID=1754191 RepID=A0A1Y1VE45_9FUNG|nr:hypothetical protein BCR36DRAFT_586867 [Piromyces finnis]ORX43444.1 hypothetical protein BCR36DRAFT_586713 [Piromyces finnis]ORX48648.1 hypothetical protein BCR36DRAFT_584212 [Piromyces finnis]ORX52938.1 hypothetical protein BCR36DRAFT_582342 [Piromyces finnis]ORX53895.1 hypothetical protein BCR36DRAFT_582113 [Piromyces finnis]|eukprot:ORX43058.1 hypothetical protein BCR36DRAFT_586867 [Piromyces finnis]